jgi:5'-deoxynucleotidase
LGICCFFIYKKCIEERKAGNQEFKKAESSTKKKISALNLKEADIFMEEFLPAFELSLDQL